MSNLTVRVNCRVSSFVSKLRQQASLVVAHLSTLFRTNLETLRVKSSFTSHWQLQLAWPCSATSLETLQLWQPALLCLWLVGFIRCVFYAWLKLMTQTVALEMCMVAAHLPTLLNKSRHTDSEEQLHRMSELHRINRRPFS